MKLKEAQDLLLQGYSCRYDEKDLDKLFKLFDIEGVSQENNKCISGDSQYYYLAYKKWDGYNRKWDGYRNPLFRLETFNLLEVNMEFILPENWHVVVTEENKEVLAEWRGIPSQNLTVGIYVVGMCYGKNGSKGHNPKTNLVDPDGFFNFGIEITYDQFLTHVLKQDNMKTDKKLIGYKLIKPEYEKLVDELANGVKFNDLKVKRDYYCITDNRFSIEKFETAGVLSLWFEEVYEEQIISYSEGDYLYCKESFYMNSDKEKEDPRFIKGKVYKATGNRFLPNEYGNNRHQMDVGGKYSNNKTFNDYFRFATEEEIKEHNKKKDVVLILGSSKIRVVISKGKITADGKDWSIKILESMYLTMTDITLQGYSIKYPNIIIGCSTFTYEEIKQIIDTYQSFE